MMTHSQPVRVWQEKVEIPTYRVGEPDRNPMFLEKRVYQGSSGAVYPYPVIDQVADVPTPETWTAVYLENRYLKIMLLPELGGRVQMALDKTNGYHFIYYNQVIKPALVGLAGPWISGGIEFNWPQHHRPSTYMPVEWQLIEHADGSATVVCAEIERMFFTKGLHAFTLHPDRAVLQIDVQLSNRTDQPQTFLWWANPAVHVNDDYQSVFPPDVHAVMDHGKRDVSDFPIATGTYYKVNYAPGTDISRYKNIPVPTSYMAHHSDFDFVGDYDHGRSAGMLHVANHHLVPGKKQWTWGNSTFGQAWDRHLTDSDGPYIELMCGAFTDNQPDFSWLMPGEEKRFRQSFLPYKAIGPATQANEDAVLRLGIADDNAELGVYVTQPRTVRVVLAVAGVEHWARTAELSPEATLSGSIALPPGTTATSVTVRVLAADGRELLTFTPLAPETAPRPEPARPAPPPSEVASNEELYLHGLHLEQYRHATFAPEPYYQEALRRDPGDSRCHVALGRLLWRHGQFAAAEAHLRAAIERLTQRNPNPYDGEAHYQLGLVLTFQGRLSAAFDAFYKATWNAAWQDSAFFQLARLAATQGAFEQALGLTEDGLRRNHSHHPTRHLKIALLRRLGRADEAAREIARALELDPLEYGALWERELAGAGGPNAFAVLAAKNTHLYVELALDYARAGLHAEALTLLGAAPTPDPLVHYYRAVSLAALGEFAAARGAVATAEGLSPDGCFPHRVEALLALQNAQRLNSEAARAPYYLGNFWYAQRQYDEAIAAWEQARARDPRFPTVQRNLGLAYYNKRNDATRALAAYEAAVALDPADARVLFEYDQLRKRLNHTPAARLATLAQRPLEVARRDDLTVEWLALLNIAGRSEEALATILARNFHPWEGGEGKAPAQYVAALVNVGLAALAVALPERAIETLQRALTFPLSLGEGKLPNAFDNNVHYWLGRAHQMRHDAGGAIRHFELATRGSSEPASALYYNDQPPDLIFYRGLALRALGREAEACAVFQTLADYGRAHAADQVAFDYFAVSLPDFLVFDDDLSLRNRIHCDYMLGLGLLGLGQAAEAIAQFTRVLEADAAHLGAHHHMALCQADAPLAMRANI